MDRNGFALRGRGWYKAGMKHLFCLAVTAIVCMAAPRAAADSALSADELLASVRNTMTSQGERDVQGQLRKGRTKVPFGMSVRGDVIAFQYKPGTGWKRFDLHIKGKGVEIAEVVGGKAAMMPAARYTESIAGTDICYEDMSLRFLYWKNGRILDKGVDPRVKGRDCWVVEIPNPKPSVGQFAWMRAWIDKENGTTWQIDGYDAQGRLKKRFSITSVQKLKDGTWFFKQMKLEVRDPANPARTVALDYIEMDDLPNKKS